MGIGDGSPMLRYIIKVETGIKWRAGTKSTVWFTLYGTERDTGINQLASDVSAPDKLPTIT